MKKFIFLALLLGIAAKGEALLPPLYTTLNEFKALIEDPKLTEKLNSGEAIKLIKRTEKGFFVLTNKHILFVDVVPEETGLIGPAQFHLKFNNPIPRSKEKYQSRRHLKSARVSDLLKPDSLVLTDRLSL